ncbi:MAG TPA: preprotein translocase subunit SecG [Bacteroidales bacterium]|nr:preprotein translocase subunit SecG [Bacteroidales bacterium]HPE55311.1 preprotein translocase subunit SecG [Bacteroidales bacterium]HRX95918.1 preprotein translocase subunit SecG [Bacteroidales bacterium]
MGAYIFIAVLIIITCVLLTLIVLVQSSKGGGLASNFSGSNQFMGVRKTADFLEKSTWTLAVALLVFSLFSIFVIPRGGTEVDTVNSELQEKYDNMQPIQDFTPPPTGAAGSETSPEGEE